MVLPSAERDKHGPAGLVFDVLFEIRKAMRALRRAEKRIKAHERAEKRRLDKRKLR